MPTQKITRTQLPGALKAHAIIIAINKYDKIGAHLRTPIADGEALKETLINHQGFAAENVHTCYDPTKRKLRAFFRSLKKKGVIAPKDGLVFYYAGHGLAGDIDGAGAAGYLMPSDVSFSKGELAKNKTLIKMEWLFDQLETFECHHTLAIMDCCFAGAFRRISHTRATMGLGLRPMSQERFKRYQKKRAWQVLASAGPAEKAADLISERGETAKNSPFAQALVKVLSGKASADFKPAGKNLGDGVLTAHELFIFLHDEVERRTRKSTKFKPQNPDLFPMGRHDGGQFVFCDPRHPHNDPKWDERKRENPYKGLEQYDVADADYYFGRTSDVNNLQQIMQPSRSAKVAEERVESPILLVVSGPSGSGKSSLVKAGLLPSYLEQGYEVFQFRPGDRPWSLKKYEENEWKEVRQSEDDPFRFVPPSSIDEIPASTFFGQPAFCLNANKPQVLYLDQFEELYTTCNKEEQTRLNLYFKELLEAASVGQLRIIISMRSDFEWQLEVSEFGQQFWGHEQAYYDFFKLYRLSTLGLDDLRSALVNPATLFAYEFAQEEGSDLTDEILEDLNYLPSALPLLSYTMQEMVARTSSSERTFKHDTYRKDLGGVSGALSKRMQVIYDGFGGKGQIEKAAEENIASDETTATETLATATPKQVLLRQVFLRMVSLSDGAYTRRRVYRDQRYDELRFAEDNKDVKIILDALRAANLISTGGEAGIRYEELIHDSLINTWTMGKQWINEYGKENLSLQRELWKAVLDSANAPAPAPRGYEKEQNEQERSLTSLSNSFSRLWDKNPKLLQVIKQAADASLFLLKDKDNALVNEMLADASPADKTEFLGFWHKCHEEQQFPDLNSMILSGYSGKVLEILLKEGKHGFNLAEIEFIQQSWAARIKDIMNLKRDRDEAKAYATAARSQRLEGEDPSVAVNLALAAYSLFPMEETAGILHDNLNNLNSCYQTVATEERANYGFTSRVAFTPDGKSALLGGRRAARLWNIESGEKTRNLVGWASKVAFAPDGKSILTGGGDNAKLWYLNNDQQIAFTGHSAEVVSVAFAPDGKSILTGSWDKTTIWWNLKGEKIKTFDGHSDKVADVAFAPDGEKILVTCDDQTINVWNLKDEKRRTFTSNRGEINSAIFSPDSQTILTANEDHTASLWSLEGEELQTFKGHAKKVERVAFAPDGQSVLTGSWDNTAILWDLQGFALQTFRGHSESIYAVAFTEDNQSILTWGMDHQVKCWRNFYGEWRSGKIWDEILKLTPEQRTKYKVDWEY